jgi:AraC-like DNA-binding protein
MVSEQHARERIQQLCADAEIELADERWETASLLLADAADTAKAQLATPVRLRTVEAMPRTHRYSTSLERGLRVLAMFNDRPIWRLADLADTLGYSRSTLHRYLISLVAMGQLEQTSGRLYRRADVDVR